MNLPSAQPPKWVSRRVSGASRGLVLSLCALLRGALLPLSAGTHCSEAGLARRYKLEPRHVLYMYFREEPKTPRLKTPRAVPGGKILRPRVSVHFIYLDALFVLGNCRSHVPNSNAHLAHCALCAHASPSPGKNAVRGIFPVLGIRLRHRVC